MMLRNDTQQFLHEVVLACYHAADVHLSGSDLARTASARGLLSELAARRGAIAARLAEDARSLGDLPQRPDPDTTTITELITRVRVALTEEADRLLLERSCEAETELAAAIERVFLEDLPSKVRTRMLELVRETEDARASLRQE